MPTWGMHLLTAKKISEKVKISDYNNFLIGNVLVDANNGYVIPDVSNIISHKETHYYTKTINKRTGEIMYCDIDKCINDNKGNLSNSLVIGYITHLLTDVYWNNLTYTKHGVRNDKGELIGVKLNNGEELIADGETRRKIKTEDFRTFSHHINSTNVLDIPKYDKEIYKKAKEIKTINLTDEDIKKVIEYLNTTKHERESEEEKYKIFTYEEMEKNVDKCVDKIIKFFEKNDLKF